MSGLTMVQQSQGFARLQHVLLCSSVSTVSVNTSLSSPFLWCQVISAARDQGKALAPRWACTFAFVSLRETGSLFGKHDELHILGKVSLPSLSRWKNILHSHQENSS